MVQAYSRLKQVLDRQKLTVANLYRRIQRNGLHVSLKSLYRLTEDEHPLERLDLRVAGVICHVCQVPLSELIAFRVTPQRLRSLAAGKQKRLDVLMAKNNEGRLTNAEQRELRALVDETEKITLDNARKLARQRQPLAVS